MKTALAIMVMLVIFAWMQECVESTSPMRCGRCDQRRCRQVRCPCGGYPDQCNCCTRCFKCPGDSCSTVAMERCVNGLTCKKLGVEPGSVEAYNMNGKCM